jgi:hypothetical protein
MRVSVMDVEMWDQTALGKHVDPIYLQMWPDEKAQKRFPLQVDSYTVKVLTHVRVCAFQGKRYLKSDNFTSLVDAETFVNDREVVEVAGELEMKVDEFIGSGVEEMK